VESKGNDKERTTGWLSQSVVKILLVFMVLFSAGLLFYGCRETPDPAPDEADGDKVGIFAAGDFENPETCATCHVDIYNAWAGSLHAYAWTNDLFQVEYVMAHEDTDGLTDTFCAGCHTPIGVAVGQVPPYDGSKLDETSIRGVSCDYCHTVSAVVETKNAMTKKDPGNVKRGPRGDGSSPVHEVMFSEVHKSSELCGACHNVNHPINDLPLETTYTEWEASPYAAEGITCQDCHMTPGPGVGKNPGKSATTGKERDHVATHFFVGGGVMMFRTIESEIHALKAEERLRAAVELDVQADRSGNDLQIKVDVTNVGAGHMLPTGLTNIRKMWLEVTVEDEAGSIIYRSGHELDGNHIDPNAVFFHTVFGDGQGIKTDEVWAAEEVLFEQRIPPKETFTQVYDVKAEEGDYRIQARILYRSAPQYLADKLFGEKALIIPTVEAGSAVIEITK